MTLRAQSWWTAATVLTAALIVTLSPGGTAQAQDAGSTTVTMTSEPGDWIGQGRSYQFSSAAGDDIWVEADNSSRWIKLSITKGGVLWSITLAAAQAGPALRPGGVFTGAARYPLSTVDQPGMEIDGEHRGCNTVTGTFTIRDIVLGPASYFGPNLAYLQRLDASFEQHCDGSPSALRGEIHIDEPVAPPPAVTLTADPDVVGAGSDVTLTARANLIGRQGSVYFLDGARGLQGGTLVEPNVYTGRANPGEGIHYYTATLSLLGTSLPELRSAVVPVLAVSGWPAMKLAVTPPGPVVAPDAGNTVPVTLTATDLPTLPGAVHFFDGTTDLGEAHLALDGSATLTVPAAATARPHRFVAVFLPSSPSGAQSTSALSEYEVRPCTCDHGAYVPLDAANDSQPYAGGLTLTVAAGTRVQLQQIDPSLPGGHPVQGTDPTGHRHAWVFTGRLTGVAVTDSRPAQPGWALTGQAFDFTNGAATVPAANLGWRPAYDTDPGDAEGTVNLGAEAPSRLLDPGSEGVAVPRLIAMAVPGSGLGTVRLTTDLELRMPDVSPKGNYQSTLTLTLINP
ncbi:hypothetical protein AB0K00_47490 [Dactylosporangium sp. NPDC049525]|uniref:hypothetical protein n=1 Tax=Dactylosporangium sp. NPDC049525 TaxID=3154730 RepID=UPI0034271291